MVKQSPVRQASLIPGAGPVHTLDEFEEQVRLLMKQLGIAAVPPFQMMRVAIDRITIPGRDHPDVLKEAERLARTIAIPGVGVLQPPGIAIAPDSPTDDLADPACTFMIIWGRRRTIGSAIAATKWGLPDLTSVTCKVYLARSTPGLCSFLAFIENTLRELSWRKDIADLATLVQEGVGMSEDDLVKRYGVARTVVREYLRLARLPGPLRRQITDGTMSKETARKLSSLKQESKAYLAELAASGAEISFAIASEQYVAQVNAGLAQAGSLQRALALDISAYFAVESSGNGSYGVPPAGQLQFGSGGQPPTIEEVHGVLLALETRALLPPYVREHTQALRAALARWQDELSQVAPAV